LILKREILLSEKKKQFRFGADSHPMCQDVGTEATAPLPLVSGQLLHPVLVESSKASSTHRHFIASSSSAGKNPVPKNEFLQPS
jgi:hypothetical protein